VSGVGSYVPERRLLNSQLERMVATTGEWIVARTGIWERHIIAPGQATSDLAIEAGRRALAKGGMDARDLQLIVVATATPDQITPSTACHVQRELGAHRAAGFDLNAACSGFLNALMTGHHLVAGGAFENALVIGADALSSITDYQDRESCVLFGDGAGAVLIRAKSERGELLDHSVGMDGTGSDLIMVPAGGSREPTSHATVDRRAHYLTMQGRKVFRFAVQKICDLVHQMTERNGLSLDDIGLLIPHQANQRILDSAARMLGIDPRRVLMNVDRYGNTSNASIPLALDEAVCTGRMEPGLLVALVAFGGGLTWGATLLRW
jgi:3-oxoacyl-[acyl-carrier-protein] synthase-3